MQTADIEPYRQILTQIVGKCDCHSRPAVEFLVHADMIDQAVMHHSRYLEELSEEIRVRICGAARRALARLETGEFGRCVDCGALIDAKRLDAVPWAECCVQCQAQREILDEQEEAA